MQPFVIYVLFLEFSIGFYMFLFCNFHTNGTMDIHMDTCYGHCGTLMRDRYMNTERGGGVKIIKYTRERLFKLRSQSNQHRPAESTMKVLHGLGILHYRGKRAGCHIQRSISTTINNRNNCRDNQCDGNVQRMPRVLSRLQRVDMDSAIINVKVGQLNLRSIGNKSATVADIIVGNNLSIFCAVETWHTGSDCPTLISATPPGYSYIEQSRSITSDITNKSNHGGVCMFYHTSLSAVKINTQTYTTFECICCRLRIGKSDIIVVTFYRPGSKPTDNNFFSEIDLFFTELDQYNCNIYCFGDLNIHLDIANGASLKFADILNDHDLVQHIDEPTHLQGHTIDVVITRSDMKLLDINIQPPSISDHTLILLSIDETSSHSATKRETKQVRKWRGFNSNRFNDDLLKSDLFSTACTDIGVLADMYNSTLNELLDKHAPLITVNSRVVDMAEWFDNDCRDSRIKIRSLERTARRTDLLSDWSSWIKAFKAYRILLERKKDAYWSDKISSYNGDSKQLWNTVSQMIDTPKSSASVTSVDELATFFQDKVLNIRTDTMNCVPPSFNPSQPAMFTDFIQLDNKEITALISNSKNKQSPLDPTPTWLIKKLSTTFSIIFGRIINCSLSNGIMPSSEKKAIVFPRLKKAGADVNVLANYRPISNLSYMSKLIERAVADQVFAFVELSGKLPVFQSAYRPFHSTETALVKIYNDLVLGVDKGLIVGLVLLDMSAAFDTVDYSILLERLKKTFGIDGVVIEWFSSYLTDRTFSVKRGSNTSQSFTLTCGVPQGSILGPLLYLLYVAELSDIVLSLGISAHFYADDGQLYIAVKTSDVGTAKVNLCKCIEAVHGWCGSNRLKLNPDKTELIWFGSERILNQCNIDLDVTVNGNVITHKHSVRDLGILLDENLNLNDHISQVSRSCTYQLRRLRTIRKNLNESAAKTLVNAFVHSKLDYCNSLLYGLPDYVIKRLQRLQNNAARLVAQKTRFESITPVLHDLHWLPVSFRIQFKLCTLVYKSLHNEAPQYLKELCHPVSSSNGRKNLRSAIRGDLCVPKTCKKIGDRAFSVCGPKLWNDLPETLRNCVNILSFKRQLKSYLFQLCYSP